ncbi:MAG: formylglycine-generating enzyme family protein [Proteobacteria bacterium]|nr:formylglycine-generating enzyme family protein [Pseudomonadota bacterium]MCP4916850.1 formylglycine-generating enzyme family protein [Pseudomonadota bacterium]
MLRGLSLGLACSSAEPVAEPVQAVPEGMTAIPAGSFTMGRDRAMHADQTPAHTVTISAFTLEETLVTVADFRAFVEATGHVTDAERQGSGKTAFEGMAEWEWLDLEGITWRGPFPENHTQADDEPVVMVSWKDAATYCEHHGRRLPSEAEWEYAMRAGATGRYPSGEDTPSNLNYWQGEDHTLNTREDGFVHTSPVRAFEPNGWGLYDPVGNVWQYTADWYAEDTFSRGDVTDPVGPQDGEDKVGRGGSWWCSKKTCSGYGLFARGKAHPRAPFSNNGFRCAL